MARRWQLPVQIPVESCKQWCDVSQNRKYSSFLLSALMHQACVQQLCCKHRRTRWASGELARAYSALLPLSLTITTGYTKFSAPFSFHGTQCCNWTQQEGGTVKVLKHLCSSPNNSHPQVAFKKDQYNLIGSVSKQQHCKGLLASWLIGQELDWLTEQGGCCWGRSWKKAGHLRDYSDLGPVWA